MTEVFITQNHGVTLTKQQWRANKDIIAKQAITLTKNLSPEQQEKTNQIADFVQREMNLAQLTQDKVKLIVEKLKLIFPQDADKAAQLLKQLIILSKHNNDNKSATKLNWFFGRTNFTKSMSYFLNRKELNHSNHNTIQAMEYECEGEVEEIIAKNYSSAKHFVNAAECFEEARNLYNDKELKEKTKERVISAYDQARSLYVNQFKRGDSTNTIDSVIAEIGKVYADRKSLKIAEMLHKTATSFFIRNQYTHASDFAQRSAAIYAKHQQFEQAGDFYKFAFKALGELKNKSPSDIKKIRYYGQEAEKLYRAAGEPNKAQEASKLYKSLIDEKEDLGKQFLDEAELAENQGSYYRAAPLYKNAAIELIKSLKAYTIIASAYEKAGHCYAHLSYGRASHDKYIEAGNCYHLAASYYKRGDEFENALEAYTAAVKNFAKHKHKFWVKKALKECDEALNYASEIRNPSQKIESLINELNSLKGEIQFQKNKLEANANMGKEKIKLSKRDWFAAIHPDKYSNVGVDAPEIVDAEFKALTDGKRILNFGEIRNALFNIRQKSGEEAFELACEKFEKKEGLKKVVEGILDSKLVYPDNARIEITGWDE
jgi:tetratricopeptide (TPR) repeat protein